MQSGPIRTLLFGYISTLVGTVLTSAAVAYSNRKNNNLENSQNENNNSQIIRPGNFPRGTR